MHINEYEIPPICIFYGLDEFFKNKDLIREEVDCMNLNQLLLYRMYIYSTPFVTDYIRNSMWDFLMRDEDDMVFVKIYYDYKKNKKNIN